MRDLLKLALVGLFMNLGTGVTSAQGRADLVGQWGTTVNGQQVVLTLNADGSADLMGTPFSWQAQGNTITVSGPQGQLPGEIRGGQLIFNLSGQQYAYTRMGGGSAPPPVASGGGGGLAGSWTTSANGQQLTMTLRPDGSGDALGAPITWQGGNGTVIISSAQGQLQGTVQNGRMVFNYNGQQFVWLRAGGAAASPAPVGPAFKPEKTLPSHAVTPEKTQMKINVPDGWAGAWKPLGDTVVYAFTVPGMEQKAAIGATAKVLGQERNLPIGTLVTEGAKLLWGQAAAGTPVVNETFSVNGHPAGRVIHRATIPHPMTGQLVQAEGYFGLVVINEWAFGFVGVYEVAQAGALRPGMDTLLAGLSGTTPARNLAMEAKIVGCYEKGSYKKSSDKSGGSSRSTYVTIKPGSTYARKSHVSVETAQPREDEYWRVPGASVLGTGGEEGTFMIHGPLITWMPNGGISYSNLVEWVSGGLYLDGKVWVGCT